MKKILLLLVVIAIGTSVFAQDVKFGVKGGLNFANYRGDDPDGDTKTDIYFGGFVRMELSETVAFQPELIYSRQGSKGKEDGVEAKIKNNYLNVPLLVRAKMFGSENLNAIVGPQIGIHLSSEGSEDDGSTEISGDMDEVMSDLDFSLALGLEYDINDSFSIGARYNLGVSEIFNDDYFETDAKNSVFQIGVAFAF